MNSHQRRKQNRKLIRSQGFLSLPTYIRDWADLAKVLESTTHRLEIEVDNCNGWIKDKRKPNALGHYLSTHTFYGSSYRQSTRLLRRCGFNVTLANWDADTTNNP
jgi:hypothetical protein